MKSDSESDPRVALYAVFRLFGELVELLKKLFKLLIN